MARNPEFDPMIAPARHHNWHIELTSRRPNLPWMLLFHGFLGCGEAMKPLARHLGSHCNPLLIDLPGHGKTRSARSEPLPNGPEGDPNPGFQTRSQIEDLPGIIDRLQCGPVWLCGYSMGGRLALQLATRYPDRVRGLILESSTAGIVDEAARRERQELDRQRARAILQDLPGFLKTWERMPLFKNSERSGENDSNRSAENTENAAPSGSCPHSPEGLAASLLGFGTGQMPSVWEALGSVRVPVLLVSGEQDLKFVDIHETMARKLPDATHIVVEGSGHRVHRDRPDVVAGHILEFLR